MNILNIIQGLYLGGMEHANLLTLKCLINKGYDISVFSLTPVDSAGILYEREGISVQGFPYTGKFGLLSHHKIRLAVKSCSADFLIVTGPSLSSCLAARAINVPKVLCVHFHHGKSRTDLLKWRLFYQIFEKDYNLITFCTNFILQEALSIYPPLVIKAAVLQNIFQIPNAISANIRKHAREHWGIPNEVPVVGNAGWLISRKRFDLLLRIAARISQELPNLRVLIAGAGPEESFLQGLAKKLGLEGRVHWLGWQQDLSKFYQALDLCIFNSDADALGRTPIEAMAYGLPVIASVTYGGLGDVIHHGKNGIFLDKHDVSLLAEYAIKILNSERMRKQIGTAARKYIKENYIPEVVCEIFHSNLIKYNII